MKRSLVTALCTCALIHTPALARTAPPKLPTVIAKPAPLEPKHAIAAATPPLPESSATIPKRRHSHRVASPAIRRVAAANRDATREPASQGFINANQVYAWNDGAIYQAYTAPGAVTDIALQPGENLIAVASGDTVRWVIGDTTSGSGADKRTHILVKPFASGLATNLVITTDRRSYHLQLASTERTAMTALSWTYPQDALIALKRAATDADAAAPVASGLAIDALNFDYAINGDHPSWRPLRAFDDGRQTFIAFPATIAVGEAPPLFVIGREGTAELVNYRMRGRFYIVDRLFDVAELRLGLKKQDIVRIERGDLKRHRHQRRAS
jgi:type IV secretion system protein TrbG